MIQNKRNKSQDKSMSWDEKKQKKWKFLRQISEKGDFH